MDSAMGELNGLFGGLIRAFGLSATVVTQTPVNRVDVVFNAFNNTLTVCLYVRHKMSTKTLNQEIENVIKTTVYLHLRIT
jgi:hypothetical protein